MASRSRVIALIIVAATAIAVAGAAPRRSVLIVLPDPPGRPLSTDMLNGIQSELERIDPDIAISSDYVSQIGKDRPGFDAAQLEWFRTKYQSVRFDAIIAVGPQALASLVSLRRKLWPDVPVVFCALDPQFGRLYQAESNITGILLDLKVDEDLQIIRSLLPNLHTIAVVGGASSTDRFLNSSIFEAIRRAGQGLEFLDLSGLGLSELKARVSSLPERTAILVVSYLYDSLGRPMFQRDLAETLAAVANAPIFAGSEYSLGAGNVGGKLKNFELIGREAARTAARVLNGETPSSIPIMDSTAYTMKFDWNQLRRWNIAVDRLPTGSTILFRTPSFMERYRWRVAGVAAASMVESLLIAVLLFERRRARKNEAARKSAELEVRSSREEISHLNRIASMGELGTSLAHELNQPLTGILSNAQAATRFLNRTPPDLEEVRAALKDIQEDDIRAGEIIHRMRNMLKRGHVQAVPLDLNTVVKDAVDLLRSDAQLRRIDLAFDLTPEAARVSGDSVQLQQVIINLVLNAMEAIDSPGHAANGSAHRIMVRTLPDAHNQALEVSVTDSGPGIPVGLRSRVFQPFFSTKREGLGMGLSISRSIVEAHGGRISVEEAAWGTGTTGATIRVELPVIAPVQQQEVQQMTGG